jgi:hypothetical protein
MNTAFALATVFTILAGLWLDRAHSVPVQAAVALCTWSLLFAMGWRAAPEQRTQWLVCLAWASAGEIVLSLVWGLYDYRLGNLPLFVPPGHVLLFALGVWLSQRVPAAWLGAVPALAAGLVVSFAWLSGDTLSLPLLALFLLCVRFGPSPSLYSTMFVLALLMELYGTATGAWIWRADVPGLPLGAANPPLAAGALYCALDWLTGLSRSRQRKGAPDRACALASDSVRT